MYISIDYISRILSQGISDYGLRIFHQPESILIKRSLIIRISRLIHNHQLHFQTLIQLLPTKIHVNMDYMVESISLN